MKVYKTCLFLMLSITMLQAQSPSDFVNPFIGTSNFGATHPGAQYPHGLASVVPFNVAFKKGAENKFEKDSEWHSRPYVHENTFLTGFSHVNLSGVGCPDLGSILLMPTAGTLELDPEQYGSTYKDETARPGYYSNTLEKHNIKVEVTSTPRTGLSRYTFAGGQANILLNLGLGLTNETGAMLRMVSDREVEGFKMIGTFCYNPEDVRPVYFVAKLSKAPKEFGTWKKMPTYKGVEGDWVKYNDAYKPYPRFQHEMAGENLGAYFSFDTEENETIEVKVGVSYVSMENARENLEKEQVGFDFEGTAAASKKKWDELLGRIELKGAKENKVKFYTALYHVLTHPSVFQDVNGEYPLMGQFGSGKIEGRNRYTVFSLWDTNRNLHPLLSLIYPEIQSEMVRSMVDIYKESGWLPKWELMGMETGVMVGDPGTPVITDTYLRGIRDFDVETAFEGMKKAAMTEEKDNPLRPDIDAYMELGYIPMDKEGPYDGTVSTALEYYIADWNIATLAKELGKTEDYTYFLDRSLGYKNYFDAETGMLRPKRGNGEWFGPFDPAYGKNFEPVTGYVEGNAWQYRFYVPHDMRGLIQLLGGEKDFASALQTCFETDNYNMANEPDITYPFLFNYVKGEAWRTQEKTLELIDKYYPNAPHGIPGNDDTGTLSTWLIFSMMGFYPVCPGDMDYALFTPSFEEITIHLNEAYYPGKKLTIKSTGSEQGKNRYINKIRFNGKKVQGYFFDHNELVKGGVLEFSLQDKPFKK